MVNSAHPWTLTPTAGTQDYDSNTAVNISWADGPAGYYIM